VDTPVLDHVGIAVEDASALAGIFQTLFGLRTDEPEQVGPHRLRFVGTGDATLELVEALTDEAPIAKYIASRGPGLHHVCLRVTDIDEALSALVALGVKVIDQAPRRGAHGSRIAFIHPSATGGILVELKEPAPR
jgi:methylmalonyl-CoA/ethylmalonyl-CoA epimerase